MATKEQKNRRYRNAKISEHRLRRVVECFAKDMTAAETVKATNLSAPTVNLIFHRLRERMRDHGLFVPKFDDGAPHPLAAVFNPKHRGVPERLHNLHAIERLHRILCAHISKASSGYLHPIQRMSKKLIASSASAKGRQLSVTKYGKCQKKLIAPTTLR